MTTNTIGPDGLRDDERERQRARHPGPLTGIYETPPEYAARLRSLLADERMAHAETRAALERIRTELVGAMTAAGIYMLVDEDPTGPGEVSRAVKRLQEERDRLRARFERMVDLGTATYCDTRKCGACTVCAARALLGEVKS